MSQPQVVPAPAAPQAPSAKGPATYDDAAGPPGDAFAPALADAVAGTGPPGKPGHAKPTRTADAEGDKAGSDSSGAQDDAAPAAAGAAAALVVAANAVAAPPCSDAPAASAPTGPGIAAATQPATPGAPAGPDAAPLPEHPAPQIELPEGAAPAPTPADPAGPTADAQPPAAAAKPAPTPKPPLPAVAKDDVVETSAPAAGETDVRRGDGADKASLAPHPPAAPAAAGNETQAAAPGPQAQPAETATTPAHAAPAHAHTTAAPATAPGATAPVNSAPPEPVSHATEIPSPVRLTELAQAARTAIAVTARQGGTVARIVLHPRELGTVEIRLSYGADGISATVRADSPQAAQALAQGGGDLRQALASHGLDLLELDIRDRRSDGSSHHHHSSHSRQAGPDDSHVLVDETEIPVDAARLPRIGTQIDVLA